MLYEIFLLKDSVFIGMEDAVTTYRAREHIIGVPEQEVMSILEQKCHEWDNDKTVISEKQKRAEGRLGYYPNEHDADRIAVVCPIGALDERYRTWSWDYQDRCEAKKLGAAVVFFSDGYDAIKNEVKKIMK